MRYTPMVKINQKVIRPRILANVVVRRELLEDLMRMGYVGLFYILWKIKYAEIIEEVFTGKIPCQLVDNHVRGKTDY